MKLWWNSQRTPLCDLKKANSELLMIIVDEQPETGFLTEKKKNTGHVHSLQRSQATLISRSNTYIVTQREKQEKHHQ